MKKIHIPTWLNISGLECPNTSLALAWCEIPKDRSRKDFSILLFCIALFTSFCLYLQRTLVRLYSEWGLSIGSYIPRVVFMYLPQLYSGIKILWRTLKSPLPKYHKLHSKTYRKIPNISPGLIAILKHILGGLYSVGLHSEGILG